MVARRPARPVEAALPAHLQGRQGLHPIHLRPVDPRQRGQIPGDIKAGGGTLACAPLAGRRRQRGVDLHVRHKRLETRVNLRLTRWQRLLQNLLLRQGLR